MYSTTKHINTPNTQTDKRTSHAPLRILRISIQCVSCVLLPEPSNPLLLMKAVNVMKYCGEREGLAPMRGNIEIVYRFPIGLFIDKCNIGYRVYSADVHCYRYVQCTYNNYSQE